MVFLFLPTRKIVPNLSCCDTPLDVSFLVCLFVWVVASHMHWPSLVGVSTLVNYNERHVDKVIWEGGGLFSFQRPAQVQDVGGHAPEDQKQRGRGGMIVSFLPLKRGVFLERQGAYFMLFDRGSRKTIYGIMCWFWNVISFRYPLLVHERAYGSYYKSIIAYINDDFYW